MGWGGGELDTERKEERDQEKEVAGNRKKGENFEKSCLQNTKRSLPVKKKAGTGNKGMRTSRKRIARSD